MLWATAVVSLNADFEGGLYLQRTPRAYQERVRKIVERSRSWPKGHLPRLPDFESHLDEVGFIEDEEVDMDAFEEEKDELWESE